MIIRKILSSGIIESYSKNLLESSVNSQASKIEAWLEENLASMQMAKTMIEKLHPDETQLQTILDASCGYSENYPDGLFLADANGSFLKGTDSKKQEPNPKESMWYQEGMTRVNMAVGSAHQNPDGTNVVSASGLLNDVGNSAFVLMVSTILPVYFNYLAQNAGVSDVDYLAYWGYAASISTLIVAVLGPVMGTLADTRGFKKPLFLSCILVGCAGCLLMGLTTWWISFLVIFIIAKVGFNSSLVFYDSMLSDVTAPERMDRVLLPDMPGDMQEAVFLSS